MVQRYFMEFLDEDHCEKVERVLAHLSLVPANHFVCMLSFRYRMGIKLTDMQQVLCPMSLTQCPPPARNFRQTGENPCSIFGKLLQHHRSVSSSV